MRKQIQKFICKLLEEELISVLAVSIVMLGIIFAKANTIETYVTFTVYPAEGAITVKVPNGGESWTIGTSYNITWETEGPITDVKIELQRSVGGGWEEITASTTNDGSHPWTVTGSATSSAKIKITKVGDDTVTDQSDVVFSIVEPTVTGGGQHGGGWVITPMIDYVTPRSLANNSDVTLIIRGTNIESDATVWLGSRELRVPLNLGNEIRAIIPSGFPAGQYELKVVNPSGGSGVYGTLINVLDNKYEASVIDQSPTPLTLLPGEKVEAWVKVRNTNNYDWVRDGVNQLQLGVPGDRPSLFYDPATWIVANRAARIEESSVAYGQIATFRFYIKAPLKVGDYTDSFQPVIENIKWLSSPPIAWQVKVRTEVTPPTTGGEEYYAAKFIKQSPAVLELAPGQEVTVWVDFENTGTIAWVNTGKNPVRIGTDKPRDRSSKFRGSKWVLRNRPAVVEYVTAPGVVGRFSFSVKAPTKTGTCKESFALVAEHKTWVKGGEVYWNITVKKATPNKVSTKKLPSTGGAGEVKYAPSQNLVFGDSFEKFLAQITRTFGGLWQSLCSWLPVR